jgi:glycosyltransferase involved in cell wall biosynthesis
MRVGLDGTPMAGPLGGIRRFTEELLGALREEFRRDEYVLLSDQFEPRPRGWARKWWLYGLRQAIRRERVEVFHGTDFAVPYLGGGPSVMTVHDLSPWLMPGEGSRRVRQRAGWLLRWRVPTFVHTPTEAVRRELIAHFGWPEERVVSIGLGAGPRFEPVKREGEPYLLHVGTIEGRKNVEVLVEMQRLLRAEGVVMPLYLIGAVREGYRAPAGEGVKALGVVAEEELAGWMAGAAAVLCPSRYEGFGLPVLEAMRCGAPVIASPIAAHREVGADAVLYAGEAAEWAARVKQVRQEEGWGERGRARAAEFDWRKTARAMRELYERCRDAA